MRKSQGRLTRLMVILVAAVVGSLPSVYAKKPASQRGISPVPSRHASSAQHGPYYALVIGINEYSHLPKLKTALNDAQVVAATLSGLYGFQTNLLTNPTRYEVLRALDAYRHTLPDDASLLIYYAGHGYYDKDEDRAYWAPVDAENDTYARWIIAQEITGTARAIPARHVLIVSDSCYSGMLNRDPHITEPPPGVLDPVEHARYIDKMLVGKSRQVMSSGGNEPVADSGAPDHSVFAYAFLRGLSRIGLNVFSADELFHKFIREQVGGGSNQVPEYNFIRDSGHQDGDFVFFRLPASKQRTVPEQSQPARASNGTKNVEVPQQAPNTSSQSAASGAGNTESSSQYILETDPTGVEVFIDGNFVGQTAKDHTVVANLVAGDHTLILRYHGAKVHESMFQKTQEAQWKKYKLPITEPVPN